MCNRESQASADKFSRLAMSAWCLIALTFTTALSGDEPADPYARFLARTEPLAPAEQREKFHLPPGFTIELVAAEPAVRKPINLAFDPAGRLFVTGSIEYPQPAGSPRDEIKLLEDSDRDGKFDKFSTYANGLSIPIGISNGPQGILSYSIPRIDRYIDVDNDGRADRREPLVRGFGSQDTHGMASSFTWWIDGWMYACHGEGNTSNLVGSDGQSLTLRGGNTFRLRPDGSRLELFTHGQANPFGLCFDPRGDAYSADSHSKPATLLLRGAWYPGLGSVHDGLGFAPPIMQHYHDSTGIAGIAYYADDEFPPAYRDSLFLGNPVTGRINHDRLSYHGSTCKAVQQPDFLVCDDPWFRPVDIKLGPDGALYIADFYDRVIGHTVVPLEHTMRDRGRGRIWRVVSTSGRRFQNETARVPPNLASASVDQLIESLAHPNLVVRTQATHQLVERIGPNSIDRLRKIALSPVVPRSSSGRESAARESAPESGSRVHALWAVARLGGLDRELVVRLAEDADDRLRLHLVRALAEITEWSGEMQDARAIVIAKLSDENPFVRRVAADALGRHPREENLAPLLSLWANAPPEDALLVHTTRIAIRETLRSQGNFAALAESLGKRPDDSRRLADVSLGVRTDSSARFLLEHLRSGQYDLRRLNELLRHVVKYLDAESMPELFQLVRSFRSREPVLQRRVLIAVFQAARERQLEVPREIREWAVGHARELLASSEESQVSSGIELAWDAGIGEVTEELVKLATASSAFPDLRAYAIDGLAAVNSRRALPLLDKLLGDATESIDIKEKAADTLGKTHSAANREVLGRHLTIAPARVALAISRQLAHSREGGELLLKAVAEGKASARLLQDLVVDQTLRGTGIPQLSDRLDQLRSELPAQETPTEQLVTVRRAGFAAAAQDMAVGKRLFEQHCAVCHQVGGKGQAVGPTLDGIGARGIDRLIEDVVDPSRNVDEKFRQNLVETKQGQVQTGLIVEADENMLVLVNGEGKKVSLKTEEVESRRVTRLSSMPANVGERLSEPDFYHLMAYLLSLRP